MQPSFGIDVGYFSSGIPLRVKRYGEADINTKGSLHWSRNNDANVVNIASLHF
jgi:hypothetical protein